MLDEYEDDRAGSDDVRVISFISMIIITMRA